MQVLAIRKAEGIEDIVRGQATLDAGEERKKVKVEGSLVFKGFESLLRSYRRYLGIKINYYGKPYEQIVSLSALSPKQANVLLQATIEHEAHENYADGTGFFMSAILKGSYKAGHYKFKFSTKNLVDKIHNFAYELRAQEQRPVEIIIDGSIGGWCGRYGRNITIHAESIGNSCGYNGKNITVYAENIGHYCGGNGRKITIHAKKISGRCGDSGENITVHAERIGDYCGYEGHNIRIHAESIGNACGRHGENITAYAESFGKDCGSNSKNSTFKTPNKETLQRLKKYVERKAGNKIYFIHADGTEEKCKF